MDCDPFGDPMKKEKKAEMPTDVTPHRGIFDRFAELMTRLVSQAPYFAACVLAVLVWAALGPVSDYAESWQLIINTGTTIVTFLMVALLENSTRRSDQAIQHKLNAIADALADFMAKGAKGLGADVAELRSAVGLEDRESTSKNTRRLSKR